MTRGCNASGQKKGVDKYTTCLLCNQQQNKSGSQISIGMKMVFNFNPHCSEKAFFVVGGFLFRRDRIPFELKPNQPPGFGPEETIGNRGSGTRRMFYDTSENILVVL